MRVVFRRVEDHPLILEYSLNSFNLMGMTKQHIDPIEAWCKEQNCGTFLQYENPVLLYFIGFENAEKLTFFLLRWS